MKRSSEPLEVIVSRSAQKDLKYIPDSYRIRILTALKALRHDPFLGKPLKGPYQGFFSIRVWPYRILYRREEDTIMITAIRHRRHAYT